MSDDLEKLAKVCYDLQKRFPFLPLIGIPWMHFTNTRFAVHDRLLHRKNWGTLLVILPRCVWLFLRGLRFFAVLSSIQLKSAKAVKKMRGTELDGVIKTWGFPGKTGENDFYFGDLASQLFQRRKRFLLLSGNGTGKRWSAFANEIRRLDSPYRLFDLSFISPFRVFQMIALQWATSFYLYGRSFFGAGLTRQVLKRASQDALSSQTLMAGLYYWLGKNTVRFWNPKHSILLYEGHSWERCFIRGIKTENPRAHIIGYQHTTLLNRALELRKPEWLAPEFSPPETILTVGDITKSILESAMPESPAAISFGTFRYAKEGPSVPPFPSRKTVLVAPEGIDSEIRMLFGVAVRTAIQIPDYRWILRCHPVFSIREILKKMGMKRLPENVTTSAERNIEADFERSSVLLYRGSSSVLHALRKGLKPFYWHLPGGEVIDPLVDLDVFREKVESEASLIMRLQQYANEEINSHLPDWKKSLAYAESYIMPVNPDSMERLMELVNR